MSKISFRLHQGGSVKPLEMEYQHLFAIGYAGRNMEKTMEHIRELERDLGVPAPKKIPTIFECSNLLLTQEEDLQFVGNRTCGEVEYIILVCGDKIYIGVGSDHTDRELEGQNVLKAKQICPKPIGMDVWDYDDLKVHWDSIRVRSFQTVDGAEIPYQDGTLADILPPEKILSELRERVGDIGNQRHLLRHCSGAGRLQVANDHFRASWLTIPFRVVACFYRATAITEEER